MDDKAPPGNNAPWNSIVEGFPVGEDWVQVGERFLPVNLNGKEVLTATAQYVVHNGELQASSTGLGYRRSMKMTDKDGDKTAAWDSVVDGVMIGSQWLQVGGHFLPVSLNGKTVLKEAYSGPAPHLHEYFRRVVAFGNECTEALQALVTDNLMPLKLKAKQAGMIAEGAVFLTASFELHNPSGSGALSKEEADVFFNDLVHEEGDFAKAMGKSVIASAIMQLVSQAEAEARKRYKEALREHVSRTGFLIQAACASDEGRRQLKQGEDKTVNEALDVLRAQCNSQFKPLLGKLDEFIATSMVAYEENRAERNAAAFKVIDVDGSETIQLSEFLAAMEQGSEKHKELKKALGFDETECIKHMFSSE
jgi:hypothetical protein